MINTQSPTSGQSAVVIGGGGGLKQTLLDAGVSQTISKVAEGAHMPYLLAVRLWPRCCRASKSPATK